MGTDTTPATEAEQVERANASGRTPVVFIHGLWLLPTSWDRWAAVFEEAGYSALTPGWPDDPETVAEAKAHPEVFARKTVGQVADHYAEVIGRLTKKPVVIGHSFGGLLDADRRRPRPRRRRPSRSTRRRSAASCRCRSRRCARPRPCSRNPANRNRAVPLTYDQFRYGFANAVSEDEAKQLYETYAVPTPGRAALPGGDRQPQPAGPRPRSTRKNPERGPLLIISGEKDHTVPWAIANASFKKQKRNDGVTEIVEIPNRGHALTIDSGWREVADTALAFVQRFVK